MYCAYIGLALVLAVATSVQWREDRGRVEGWRVKNRGRVEGGRKVGGRAGRGNNAIMVAEKRRIEKAGGREGRGRKRG